MGTVHKFKRPPKNKRQFAGYRPEPFNAGGGDKPSRWRLRSWQKGVLAWGALIVLAAAIWGIGKVF